MTLTPKVIQLRLLLEVGIIVSCKLSQGTWRWSQICRHIPCPKLKQRTCYNNQPCFKAIILFIQILLLPLVTCIQVSKFFAKKEEKKIIESTGECIKQLGGNIPSCICQTFLNVVIVDGWIWQFYDWFPSHSFWFVLSLLCNLFLWYIFWLCKWSSVKKTSMAPTIVVLHLQYPEKENDSMKTGSLPLFVQDNSYVYSVFWYEKIVEGQWSIETQILNEWDSDYSIY